MDYKITGYEPAKLFHYFEEISAIPRESGNEKQISDYLVAFAKDHGLWVYQDDVHNVIIKKAASAGAEDKPAVMLQGHIDMVCDKLGSVEHDFTKDGIDLVVTTRSPAMSPPSCSITSRRSAPSRASPATRSRSAITWWRSPRTTACGSIRMMSIT